MSEMYMYMYTQNSCASFYVLTISLFMRVCFYERLEKIASAALPESLYLRKWPSDTRSAYQGICKTRLGKIHINICSILHALISYHSTTAFIVVNDDCVSP